MYRAALAATLGVLLLCTPAAAQPTAEEQKNALDDWRALGKLAKEVMNDIHKYGPNGPFGGTIREKFAERLEAIEGYQAEKQPLVESQLAAFEERYGGTPQKVLARYEELFPSSAKLPPEIQEPLDELNRTTPTPDRLLRETRAELEGLKKTRVATADGIVTQARQTLYHVDSLKPDRRPQTLMRLVEELEYAVRFDPDLEEARDMLAEAEAKVEASEELLQQVYAERRFKDHMEGFAGPGDVEDLAETALEWFQNSPDWGGKGEVPLAVAVTGDWRVAKVNILGEPVQWGLPIYLALGRAAKPDKAFVFSLTLVTELAYGVEKKPPFTNVWVGSNYTMLRANLSGGTAADDVDLPDPGEAGGEASDLGGGSSGGAVGGVSAGEGSIIGAILGCFCCFFLVAAVGGGVFFAMQKKKTPPAGGAGDPPAQAPPPAA